MDYRPNHICSNVNCPFGKNGKPKEYYACDACDRSSYRAIACSPECYAEIIKHIQLKDKPMPNRTDKSPDEVAEIMSKPFAEVYSDTLNDMAEFKDEIERVGLDGVVNEINNKIERGNATVKKKRGGKN